MPLQMIYATATWTWRKRIAEIELYNEPELEACWDSVFFVQQSVIRRELCCRGHQAAHIGVGGDTCNPPKSINHDGFEAHGRPSLVLQTMAPITTAVADGCLQSD